MAKVYENVKWVIIMNIQTYNKALISPIVTVALLGLSFFGVTGKMTVEEIMTVLITGVVTTIGTWAIPNKK